MCIDDVLGLPPVRAVGVGRDGLPVRMVGLDPRAFAILKYARAEFDPERGRNAAEIDRDQALVVGALVGRYWRHEFDPEWLEAFPGLCRGHRCRQSGSRRSTFLHVVVCQTDRNRRPESGLLDAENVRPIGPLLCVSVVGQLSLSFSGVTNQLTYQSQPFTGGVDGEAGSHSLPPGKGAGRMPPTPRARQDD